jgi:tetratricopeptide (TPR) repeat protein
VAEPGESGAIAAAPAHKARPAAKVRASRDQTAQEAKKQHRLGVEAFAADRYDEAIAAFLSADALHPSSASSFNIARAYEAKGDAARALAYYREYLRRAPAANDRTAVNGKVAKLTRRVAERGVQQVTFLATPQGSTVLVDSEPLGAAPITLELRPGDHIVEFRKEGYVPAKFKFELTSDRALDVLAKLAPARNTAVAGAGRKQMNEASSRARTDGESKSSRGPSVTRTIGFVALGASVAALGGAVTLEVMRSSAEDEARKQKDQIGFSEAYERMKSRQTMARVFAGAGGALAAVGTVLLVVATGNNERPNKDGLAFGCLPSKCHASYKAAF